VSKQASGSTTLAKKHRDPNLCRLAVRSVMNLFPLATRRFSEVTTLREKDACDGSIARRWPRMPEKRQFEVFAEAAVHRVEPDRYRRRGLRSVLIDGGLARP
jgi:hypothetical protein